jgi:hypothetical protein
MIGVLIKLFSTLKRGKNKLLLVLFLARKRKKHFFIKNILKG